MLPSSRKLVPIISGASKFLLETVCKYQGPSNISQNLLPRVLFSTGPVVYAQSKSESSGNYIETPIMSVDLEKIGNNLVKIVPSMEEVQLKTLWANDTVVITFLRRFGCLFCRQAAKELSIMTPLLAAHGVKNIAIGLEEFGVDDFVEGKFFNGELYVDIEKKSFQDMGYKRWSIMGMVKAMFSKSSRDAMSRNKIENLPNNLKGDGYQSGGTLVIMKGGTQVLLDYRQENPADHVDNSDVYRALGIPIPEPETDTSQ